MIALLLAVASLPLSWGDVVSGVRLGIGPGPPGPQPSLRLVFENVGAPEVQIPLGGMTTKGPIYNLLFRITSPAGKESSLFNLNGPTGVRGKIEPVIARLTRGQKYEILLPLNKFEYLENGKSRLLPELLAAHYSVQAILDTTGNPREVYSFALWAGHLSSGEFRQ
jgi:hypothetical protein